jgi:8-oxo-dGTP diphosphatase
MATDTWPRPAVTVDVVLVATVAGSRQVLLVKRGRPPFAGSWALPGGFVEPNEPLQMAARRELREETGLEPVRLEQLHTFGDPGRDPRGWTLSVAYLARFEEAERRRWQPRAGSDADAVGWFDLEQPPDLAFDHAQILACAVRRLGEADRELGGVDRRASGRRQNPRCR